ncbi:MAG: flavodoxin family protein [Candidatus Magasanikbacteria bacterium]|nr:flavodoxin family protein [Candidatus Magasanikbacteria bacterium]
MKILIVYATNSGSTYEVGAIIRDVLKSAHMVLMQRAVDTRPPELKKYDLVLFGSPSWKVGGQEGQIQETMQAFLESCQGKFPKGLRFAVFGCGDTDFTNFCEAVDTMAEILRTEGGQEIYQRLKIDSFYFNLEKNSQLTKQWAKKLLKLE